MAINFGHQSALFAGLFFAEDGADVMIFIDAELQQDLNAMLSSEAIVSENGNIYFWDIRNL